jgi:glycosyltransferase involved in cell wall biosynthesis
MYQPSKFVIVVPSYNCEHYVAATIESLLQQGDDLERCHSVILTDDCSQDRTIAVAKAAWNGPIPLVVFAAESNRGESRNMEECIARLPEGIEWFLIMHADDLAKPGWLATLLDHAEAADPQVASICTSWDYLAEDGTVSEGENRQPPTVECVPGNHASVLHTLRRGCWWHISGSIIRAHVYREFGGRRPELPIAGDWDFLLRLLGAGWDVAYVPRALMTYRANPAGVSAIGFRQHRDIYERLTVLRRHQMAMSPWEVSSYHWRVLWLVALRLGNSMRTQRWNRALRAVPAAGFVVRSCYRCLVQQWMERRHFSHAL